eukprot:UN07567
MAEQSTLSKRKMKLIHYLIGGVAFASLGLLLYAITRSTKKKQAIKSKNKMKRKKITVIFTKKPIDIHLVMETMDGLNAHVAADIKNKKVNLEYGAQLLKINKTRITDFSYGSIIHKLQKTKTPITLQFLPRDDLCERWTNALELKTKSNEMYKNGKIEGAIKLLTEAILLHPTNKVFHANRVLMTPKNREILRLQ